MSKEERRLKRKASRPSRFLSLILRHKPEKIGITLDEAGWVSTFVLLGALGQGWSMEKLRDVVATNDKKRFEFNEDQTRIRARQGHSLDVDLGYEPCTPPDILYHGTVGRFMGPINSEGLQKMGRHHVHLSADKDTAGRVGSRRGEPVLLTVDASSMHADGHAFCLSNNGVWLTDHVPFKYIKQSRWIQ